MASKYLLEMEDYDTGPQWFEFDSDEFWELLTSPVNVAVLPDDVVDRYKAQYLKDFDGTVPPLTTAEVYGIYLQGYRAEFFGRVLGALRVDDRDKYTSYAGVVKGTWEAGSVDSVEVHDVA